MNNKTPSIIFFVVWIFITSAICLATISQGFNIAIIFVLIFPIVGIIGLVSAIKGTNTNNTNQNNPFDKNDNIINVSEKVSNDEVVNNLNDATDLLNKFSNVQKKSQDAGMLIAGIFLIIFGFNFGFPVLLVFTEEFEPFLLIFPIIGLATFIGGICLIVKFVKQVKQNKNQNNNSELNNDNYTVSNENYSNPYVNRDGTDENHNYNFSTDDDEDEYFVKYCTNCGSNLKKKDTVCPYCNTKVK